MLTEVIALQNDSPSDPAHANRHGMQQLSSVTSPTTVEARGSGPVEDTPGAVPRWAQTSHTPEAVVAASQTNPDPSTPARYGLWTLRGDMRRNRCATTRSLKVRPPDRSWAEIHGRSFIGFTTKHPMRGGGPASVLQTRISTNARADMLNGYSNIICNAE